MSSVSYFFVFENDFSNTIIKPKNHNIWLFEGNGVCHRCSDVTTRTTLFMMFTCRFDEYNFKVVYTFTITHAAYNYLPSIQNPTISRSHCTLYGRNWLAVVSFNRWPPEPVQITILIVQPTTMIHIKMYIFLSYDYQLSNLYVFLQWAHLWRTKNVLFTKRNIKTN